MENSTKISPAQFFIDILSFRKINASKTVMTGALAAIGDAIEASVKLKERKRNIVATAMDKLPSSANL